MGLDCALDARGPERTVKLERFVVWTTECRVMNDV